MPLGMPPSRLLGVTAIPLRYRQPCPDEPGGW